MSAQSQTHYWSRCSEYRILIDSQRETFWLKICDDLKKNWTEISSALSAGKWGRHEDELLRYLGKAPTRDLRLLNPRTASFYKNIWPKLSLISSWDSSSSKIWAEELKDIFPHVEFQGKVILDSRKNL